MTKDHMKDPLLYRGSNESGLSEIGRGGEQAVFAYPGVMEVIKVSTLNLVRYQAMRDVVRNWDSLELADAAMALGWLASGSTDELSLIVGDTAPTAQELFRFIEQEIALNQLRYAALTEAFGREHVPREKLRIQPLVPGSHIHRKLFGEMPVEDMLTARQLWVSVRHQELVPALQELDIYNVHDFRVGYAEKERTLKADSYILANQLWVEQPGNATPTDEELKLFLEVQGNESMFRLIEMLDQNEAFRMTFAEFLDGTLRFAEIAGEGLDANINNIIFHQSPGSES